MRLPYVERTPLVRVPTSSVGAPPPLMTCRRSRSAEFPGRGNLIDGPDEFSRTTTVSEGWRSSSNEGVLVVVSEVFGNSSGTSWQNVCTRHCGSIFLQTVLACAEGLTARIGVHCGHDRDA